MKTLKSIIAGLAIIFAATVAKADGTNNDAALLTKNYTINTYINAIAHGKTNELNAVVDEDAAFSMVRGKQLVKFNKEEMLGFLGQNKDIEQNCKITAASMDSNNDQTVVRVNMIYSDFVRSNYVTLTNTTDGWKITSVYSVFKGK